MDDGPDGTFGGLAGADQHLGSRHAILLDRAA
jgi:hypothetical protein